METKESLENQKAAINKFDGLIHNADGTTTDPNTGAIVNNELQLDSNQMNRMRDYDFFANAGDRKTEQKEFF
jgi:hypothetical protein